MKTPDKYMYLIGTDKARATEITDSTGETRYPVIMYTFRKHGGGAYGGTRTDAWFKHDGQWYHARQQGEFNQVCTVTARKHVPEHWG